MSYVPVTYRTASFTDPLDYTTQVGQKLQKVLFLLTILVYHLT